METVTCLACGKDEYLLVCHEKGCRFAVHEKCLPCSAYFDVFGCFYCPQCSYEIAVEECIRTKKRASLAKRALLKFISAAGGNDQQPEVEVEATNEKQPCRSASEKNVCYLTGDREKENSVNCKETDPTDNLLKSEIPDNPGLMEKCHETEMTVVIGLPAASTATRRKRQSDGDEILKESSGKGELFVDDSEISDDSDYGTTIDKKVKVRRLRKEKRAKYVQRNSNDSDFQNGNADESSKQRQDRDLATSSRKRKFRNSNNRSATPTKTKPRKQWSDAEVEILKEGVQKFSVPNTKMPWGRILEYGSNVFEPYRTAVDLKDKWRNLTK